MILLIGIFVSGYYSCNASGFKVMGHMEAVQMQTWSSESTIFKKGDIWNFEVAVDGDKWTEQVVHPDQDSFSLGCDGRSVFMMIMTPETQNKKTGDYSDLGIVYSGCYPVQAFYLDCTLPWLAYCSANYIATNVNAGSTTLPTPWLPAASVPDAWIYRESYEAITNGTGLPKLLTYFPDSELIQAIEAHLKNTMTGSGNTMMDSMIIRTARLKSQHQPSAIYQVLTTTNCEGCVLPKTFRFTQYMFKSVGKDQVEKEDAPLIELVGTLDSVESISAVDPYPRSTTNIEVSDYRVFNARKHIPFVWYRAQNSAWIKNESDPALQRDALQIGKDLAPLNGLKAVITARRILVAAFFMFALTSLLFSKQIRQMLSDFLTKRWR
ncbi:MAG TPA: hypothetical protein VGN23_04230 [Verrucomicrobiae bacterium]